MNNYEKMQKGDFPNMGEYFNQNIAKALEEGKIWAWGHQGREAQYLTFKSVEALPTTTEVVERIQPTDYNEAILVEEDVTSTTHQITAIGEDGETYTFSLIEKVAENYRIVDFNYR